MKILTFTGLYPNAAQPQQAVFVENRLRHLVAGPQVVAKVVSPVPWFPFRGRMFGRYGRFAEVPRREERFGIEILHPRYPVLPKIGMTLAPLLMYAWSKPALGRVLESGYDFDLIDAHYFYPDGVAAVMLGRHFGKPVTITARGTDINVIAGYAVPGRMIRWAAERAAGLITVSQALKARMTNMKIDPGRIRVLRNGVDLTVFSPRDRRELKRKLGLDSRVIASVGNLLPSKGHDLVIRALQSIPGADLLVVGEGPHRPRLQALVRELGLENRIRFLGTVPHEEMPEVYGVADLLILASEREGWPNVLLEAMACGTPAVATNVSGIPEVLASPAAGRLLPARTADSIAATARDLLFNPPSRADTRAYAERFSWDETTEGQLELFRAILAQERAS